MQEAAEFSDRRMALKLYFHPLASFCWKALIALYENDTRFEPHIVDLMNERESAEFRKIWAIGKFPVLRDEKKGLTIPEASIIVEYLEQNYPAPTRFLPADRALALKTRLRDRFYDLYVHEPMQKIVIDKIRPPGEHDPHGVETAYALLATSYGVIEQEMESSTWAMGDAFTLADCAAAPALHYANLVAPLGDMHANTKAYLDRLEKRPSFARVLAEAKPYFAMFPGSKAESH